MSDEAWRRLHPLSVVVNLVPRLWASARTLWPLLLAWVYGRVSGAAVLDVFLVGAFLVPAVVGTVAHWATLRYRVTGDRLEIESGLWMRSSRSLSKDRIQNVEVVQSLLHRLTGLAEVRVETASGKEVEGLLSALRVDEATALVESLRRREASVADPAATPLPALPTAQAPEEVLVAASTVDLLWAGVTGIRLATLTVGLGFVLQLYTERSGQGPETVSDLARGADRVSSLLLLSLVATGGFWLSVGTTFLRYHGFRLERLGSRLVARQGLFTRRRTELRRQRVQLVTFEQSTLRRWLGFGTLSVETAAGRSDGDGTERSSAVVPYLLASEAPDLIRRILAGATDPADVVLTPPHPSAGWRAAVPAVLVTALGAAALWPLLGSFVWLAGIAVPVAGAWAALSAARQGWALTGDLLFARSGVFVRRTALVPVARIQSVATISTPLLERAGLTRVSVRIAGRGLVLPLMRAEEARAVFVRLGARAG